MRQAILDWLAELLQDWFIPRRDYDKVQYLRLIADERTRKAVDELYQVMEGQYSHWRPFQQYAEDIKVEFVEHYETHLPRMVWQFKVPEKRYFSLNDPLKELDQVKRYVVERITQEFKTKLAKSLFAFKP